MPCSQLICISHDNISYIPFQKIHNFHLHLGIYQLLHPIVSWCSLSRGFTRWRLYRHFHRMDSLQHCSLHHIAYFNTSRKIFTAPKQNVTTPDKHQNICGYCDMSCYCNRFCFQNDLVNFSAKYFPVYESGFAATSSGVPVATTTPPSLPPSGPMSMI